MTYNEFRHFADSWGLVFMGATYLVLVGWALLPRNRDKNRAVARMISSANAVVLESITWRMPSARR